MTELDLLGEPSNCHFGFIAHRKDGVFFIPIFFIMMVAMVYMMTITGLVKFLEWILQPLLLLKQREEPNRKFLRKIKVKKKTKFKQCVMSTNLDGCTQKEITLQDIICLPQS